MEDPLLRQRCVRLLDLSLSLAEKECERTKDWPDVNPLAWMYRRLFEEARTTFVDRCGTRLVTAFQQYAESGNLELITCAGTHGYLPLLNSEPSTVRAQVFTAVDEHARIFGSKPKGMWVPECAFYPGLDEVLAQAGIRYFLVDGHGIEHAEPAPMFGVHAPVYCPSGVAAFGRHPMTSKLVWSTSVGYPADFNYREYYRDIGFELPLAAAVLNSRVKRDRPNSPAQTTSVLCSRPRCFKSVSNDAMGRSTARMRAACERSISVRSRRKPVKMVAPPTVIWTGVSSTVRSVPSARSAPIRIWPVNSSGSPVSTKVRM